MTDKDLRRDVLDELDFDPSLDAGDIGVAVSEGVVTLTGHVGSYAEKVEAERAVRRVRGVRAIAQEIEVRYADEKKIADDQIAARALAIIDWSVHLPKQAIQVKVAGGWVTLTGTVDWQYQMAGAEAAVRKLSGVHGVTNLVEVSRGSRRRRSRTRSWRRSGAASCSRRTGSRSPSPATRSRWRVPYRRGRSATPPSARPGRCRASAPSRTASSP